MLPFPICVILFAVVGSVVARWSQSLMTRKIGLSENQPRIFVGIVSFCDKRWTEQVQQMMSSATHPGRVFFGVLEFVERAEDSQEPHVPPAWRSRVRVHAVSHRIATSMRHARRLCYDKTFADEPYVLFVRGASTVRGWDEAMVQGLLNRDDKSVLTAHLHSECAPTFPAVRETEGQIKVSHIAVASPTREHLSSLAWQSDLSFAPNQATDIILSASDEIEVTVRLMQEGWSIRTLGVCLAVRETHPVGVRNARKQLSEDLRAEYARRVHLGSPRATLGITQAATSEELIGKYGSLVAARVALQTVEAETGR